MPVSESELVAMIDNAFDGVVLGTGVSLNMAKYLDSCGLSPEYADLAKRDERMEWRLIPDSVLENFDGVFNFTDLLGYRFYAAPYMIWTIKNQRESYHYGMDHVINAMDPTRHQFSRTRFTDWFTPEQTHAILAFLDYWTEKDELDDREAIENAIRIRAELHQAHSG
jgi:hypothetical protein